MANESSFKSLWYLYPPDTFVDVGWATRLIMNWFKFFILYSNLMPISLYAAMEICNFFQAYFVKSDLAMYDEDQACAKGMVDVDMFLRNLENARSCQKLTR